MSEETYYTIGEVSKICNVAASTLRYYDKINLVKPNTVSVSNNYRFYTFKDIAKIRIIQNLRDLNFSLDDVERILNRNDLIHQLLLMKKKREEIYYEIQILQKTFDSIDTRINNMENEMKIIASSNMDELSIELKQIPERKILSMRRQGPSANLNLYTLYFNELIDIAKKNNIIPSSNFMLLHHHINLNNSFDSSKHEKSVKDVEVCMPVDSDFSDASLVSYLPKGLYISMITKGMTGREGFIKIYTYIYSWLKENNYTAVGPLMDLLITDITNLHPDNIINEIITEIQVPIVKITKRMSQK